MPKKKENTEKEEREFQLGMLKIQIETQSVLTVLTLFLAIELSALISLATTFLTLWHSTGIPSMLINTILVFPLFAVAIYFTLHYYSKGKGAKIIAEEVEKDIDKIREKFIGKKSVEKQEIKREKKETKEEEDNKSMSIYQKSVVAITALALISNLILSGFNLYLVIQTNQIHRESMEFQNMMYNFTSVIVAKAETAILEQSSYNPYDNVTVQTVHFGYLDIELQVITPHYGEVNIKYKHFNIGESSLFAPEKVNETRVTYVPDDKHEHLVVSGLNQLSDKISLIANVYINPNSISPDTKWVQFIIGRLFLEAELLDLQNNTTLTEEFSAPIAVVYEPPS